MNSLDVTTADIKNDSLQAPLLETHYVIYSTELGLENIGKVALIHSALYRGKSSGADFWKHLWLCMMHLGFTSFKAYPNICIRESHKDHGTPVWGYFLFCVDDALVISNREEDVIRKEIGKYFRIKDSSIRTPSIYLGNKVSKVTIENGVGAWSFSSPQYV